MPGNRKPQRSGGHSNSSSSAADKAAEGMRRVKIESNDDNGVGDKLGNFPDRPGEPDCIYYLRTGTCGYGSNCRFNHPVNGGGQVNGVKNVGELPERVGQPDCGYYLKTGTCKYGSTCKYHHPKDRQDDNQPKDNKADSLVMLNILGLPMRQDGKPCPYYMRTGSCKYGYACKFHHPQPASATNVVPVVGPIYGSGGPAAAPSSGAPSVGELSSASLSKPAYFSGSVGPMPQSYMPIILSPSQGWNYYAGSVSPPSSVTGVLTAPASNGQVSVSNLPERPDQPECRHFMNHGSCKYGSDCKYHHPREKIQQLPASYIGPLGLPIRPGQSVCSYFSLYGICKYGPTCKFDHPMDGYYAYGLSVPPIAASFSSPSPYQSTSSVVPSSQTSPSKSSKVSDWIKKGTTVSSSSSKNRHSNTESIGDSADVADSHPHSSKAPSEVAQNESD